MAFSWKEISKEIFSKCFYFINQGLETCEKYIFKKKFCDL